MGFARSSAIPRVFGWYPWEATRTSYVPKGRLETSKVPVPSALVVVLPARFPALYSCTTARRPDPAWTTLPNTLPDDAWVVNDQVALAGPHSYWSNASTFQ